MEYVGGYSQDKCCQRYVEQGFLSLGYFIVAERGGRQSAFLFFCIIRNILSVQEFGSVWTGFLIIQWDDSHGRAYAVREYAEKLRTGKERGGARL